MHCAGSAGDRLRRAKIGSRNPTLSLFGILEENSGRPAPSLFKSHPEFASPSAGKYDLVRRTHSNVNSWSIGLSSASRLQGFTS